MKNLRQIRALLISPALLARTLCTCPTFSLKNVTKSNFASTLGDLRRHISSADFVAVDLEMTGVTSAPWRESFEFDRYDVRYLKVKDSAEKFAVVQFGVCPFRWDPHKHSFVAHPHNFYIFPRQELPADGPSYEFLCQTTSIDFLARFQFDFNACIREGLSYLSRRQEDEALSRLKSAYDAMLIDSCPTTKEVKDIPLASMADILFSERMKIRFHEWRGGLLQERNEMSHFNGSLTDSEQQFETIFFKMHPALTLKGFTSHQLRLIQEVIRKHFKDLTYVRAYDENSILQKLIVFVDSEDDKIELMREVKNGLHKEAEKKIKAAVGFRQVIDIISEEKKLIVGHNCFLDLAHIYSKFFGPLPPTAEEFACHTHKFFPHVIDTKILLNADKVLQQLMKKTSTSLSSAFTLLCPEIASSKTSNSVCQPRVKVEVQVDDMRSSNWNSGAKHEAGYDAFMTGCVFAQACRHLGIDFESASPNENLAHDEKLQKYVNLVYLSWNSGDVINLSNGNVGAEFLNLNAYMKRFAKISYPNIVLIWGFPSKLQAIDIKECLCKVFGVSSVTSIYHLDETTVFVQFSKAELASDFLVLKERLESSNDPISVLHPFSKLFEGVNTHAAGYEIYKEICSSPISKVSFSEQAEAVGIKWKTRLLDSTRALEAKRHGQSGTEIERVSYGSKDTEKSEKIKRLILKTTTTNQHGNACELGDLLYGASDPPREEMMATNL